MSNGHTETQVWLPDGEGFDFALRRVYCSGGYVKLELSATGSQLSLWIPRHHLDATVGTWEQAFSLAREAVVKQSANPTGRAVHWDREPSYGKPPAWSVIE